MDWNTLPVTRFWLLQPCCTICRYSWKRQQPIWPCSFLFGSWQVVTFSSSACMAEITVHPFQAISLFQSYLKKSNQNQNQTTSFDQFWHCKQVLFISMAAFMVQATEGWNGQSEITWTTMTSVISCQSILWPRMLRRAWGTHPRTWLTTREVPAESTRFESHFSSFKLWEIVSAELAEAFWTNSNGKVCVLIVQDFHYTMTCWPMSFRICQQEHIDRWTCYC